MTLTQLIEGAKILQTYYDGGHNIGAEHDKIYLFNTKPPLPTEDVQKLIDLRWFQEDAFLGDDEEFQAKHYDPSESWCHFC